MCPAMFNAEAMHPMLQLASGIVNKHSRTV
jgi:hypothetical protein